MKTLFTVIDILPGMIAWLLEILSLTAAGIAVYRTITNQPSMFYTALSALALLGVAIASDYYTNPNKTKNK